MSNGRGYLRIKLSVQNKQTDAYVHRLVCEAYYGPCPPGMQCRHLDGDRTNNAPNNLEWTDKATNEQDKVAHGTLPRGERHAASVLTDEMVRIAQRRKRRGETVSAIADEMGVNRHTLADAVAGRRWRHLSSDSPATEQRSTFWKDVHTCLVELSGEAPV
jgi:hypothetical protein